MSLVQSYKPFRIRMAERNLSRKEVEEATGINRNTMSRLYNDKAVSIETLAVICDYLGCRIEDVVEFVPATD
ncbi:helix-turn-helix domain-containing protein [Paenibacillus odorifer]|uniref:helix-turn-helix domain-containing protein n=2 Tax=Paenibacillus TaxID=44249 RepID=UPI00096E33C2|nr:helix-turn-helix transcriptional regulator [Paenibacillus odorifer]OMD02547.1 hypothetical protein BJP46_15710 [Paenibacillus odorifer]